MLRSNDKTKEIIVKKLFFIFLFIALTLPACSSTKSFPTPSGPRATVTPLPDRPTPSADELELSDPTKPIEVNVGEDFTITVRTIPNSEYHWEIAKAFDAKIVEYVWKDQIADHPDAPSSRGKDIWRFKALASGETDIVLGYYQGETAQTLQVLAFPVVVK
jgi:predicted secreted protein